jgi:hypothetical protein
MFNLRGRSSCFAAAMLMVGINSIAQNPAAPKTPAKTSGAAPGCSNLNSKALETDPDLVNAVAAVVAQIIGNYDNTRPSHPPAIRQFWGPFNAAVLGEMQPKCVSADALGIAVQNAVKAQAVTAQTNKQVTAPPAQGQGTSLVQKVGIPQLLALAVENGAITNKVSGTTMTLSTSPYAFLTAFGAVSDTQANYNVSAWATHTGISATFNVSNSSDPLASVSRKQVSQWQAKATFRDTSIRSKSVATLYANSDLKKVADAVAIDLSNSWFVTVRTDLDIPADNAYQKAWAANLETDVADAQRTGDSAKSDVIATALLKILDADQDYQTGLKNSYAQISSEASLSALVKKLHSDRADFNEKETEFEKKIADLAKGWNGDFAFSEQFPATVTSISASGASASTTTATIPAYFQAELDVTCEPYSSSDNTGKPCPLRSTGTFTFNASAMFYPNPVASLNEKTFRGAHAALEGQWTLGPGFLRTKPENDKSNMTLSLSANYERLEENKDQPKKRPDLAIGNIKLVIPISAGVALPVSFTAASAGEQNKEKYVRGNFGITFDLDKLEALLKANR